MSRKHFEAIALTFSLEYQRASTVEAKAAVRACAVAIAGDLAHTASNFKRDMFLNACKVGV